MRGLIGKTDEEIARTVANFARFGILIEPTERLTVVSRDLKDNNFLECVVSGNASYIVSGDADLLTFSVYQDIHILPPVAFLEAVKEEAKNAA